MASSPRYPLHRSLGYQLSLTARMQERGFEDALKGLELTRTSWCILLTVGQESLHKPSDIAAHIGIDRTAASRALRQMEADGLVVRQAGSGDKRTTTVALTERGKDRLAASLPSARKNAEHFDSKLTDVENSELRRLLAKLRDDEPGDVSRL